MRRYMSMAWVIALCFSSALSQQTDKQVKRRFVVLPGEYVLVVIASQPDCPLQIAHAKRFLNIDAQGDVRYSYELSNQSAKPIVDFTIVDWNSFGNGGTLSPPAKLLSQNLMPGQTLSIGAIDDGSEILPLTDELRKELKLKGTMKAIVVLMVKQVVFSDGTTYSDNGASDALHNYFENLDAKAN